MEIVDSDLPLLLTVIGIDTLSLSLLYCCVLCRFTERDFGVSINIYTNGIVESATLWVEFRIFKRATILMANQG